MKPYMYVCEMRACPNPATKIDVADFTEEFHYLCEDHFVSVVKGII